MISLKAICKRKYYFIALLLLLSGIVTYLNVTKSNTNDTLGSNNDGMSPEDTLLLRSWELPEVTGFSIEEASSKGDIIFIQNYLLSGGSVDYADVYGKTMLNYAIEFGQIESIEFLLANGASPYCLKISDGSNYYQTHCPIDYNYTEEILLSPELYVYILNILQNADAITDTNTKKIYECIETNEIKVLIQILESKRALDRECVEKLNWYALSNNNMSLFEVLSRHPSFSLRRTAQEFFYELVAQNKKEWITIMRKHFNSSFFAYIKYDYIKSGWKKNDNDASTLLTLGCAQGNLDLVKFSLALGGEPTSKIANGETIIHYIGNNWASVGIDFHLALPDWPTENDDEIRQLLQAHIDSN